MVGKGVTEWRWEQIRLLCSTTLAASAASMAARSEAEMAKKFPKLAKHPERICWGCDKYCPADSLQCGNGSERTQHPAEIVGEDWFEWGLDFAEEPTKPAGRPD